MKNKKTIIIGSIVLILTILILNIKKVLIFGMIHIGSIFFPEASQALTHYCFGDGSTLYVQSDYIRRSPVVLKHLKKMKVGQKKKVGFHQWEDWRLSYAINPFTIEKKKNKVIITQWMEFDKTNKVLTWFGPIPIPDAIVHVFDCTPYLFYHEFSYKE